MPKASITYKKPETLKIIMALAMYLDFEIITDNENGITMIPGDIDIDPSYLTDLLSSLNLDAALLRKLEIAKMQ